MAKDLKKTILIENEDYNINAVYSDEAGIVEQPLKLIKSLTTGLDESSSFDGSDSNFYVSDGTKKAYTPATEIEYVPAGGGKFTGPVWVHEGSTSVAGIDSNEIINKGQIDTVIKQLDGAPLYTWDASVGYNAVKNDKEEDYKLNTVVGSVEDLPVFEAYSCGQAHNLYVTPDSYDNAYITYGTYKDAYFNQAYNDIRGSITKLVFPNTYVDKSTGEKKSVEKIRVNEFTANTSQNYGFTNLVTVHINPGITEIDNNAFSGCEKLTSAAIPDSVTRIGLNTFSGCTGLTSVVLGSNISTIDAGAFSKCTSLTSIAICNNSVKIVKAKKVGSTNYLDAFSGCTALTKIYFKGSPEEWNTLVTEAGLATNNPLRSATIIPISDTAFPFLYICKGPKGEDTSLTSNKMFLKLPDEDLVEISKGAARLERRDSKTSGNVDYFTYDVLAAVIAGINSRITALGSKALALPETLKVYDSKNTTVVNIPTDIANESISTDSDKALLVEETQVASVTQLQDQITKLTGGKHTDIIVPTNFSEAYNLDYNFSGKILNFTAIGIKCLLEGDEDSLSTVDIHISFEQGIIEGSLYTDSIYQSLYISSLGASYAPGVDIILPNNIGKITGFRLGNAQGGESVSVEEFSKYIDINFEVLNHEPTEYSDTVLKAKADETGRNISKGYYQSANTSVTNTITIATSIPTTESGNIGDIRIVI